ncbi:MAG: ribonuclease P protein component [Planctomycetaceae bacterium]
MDQSSRQDFPSGCRLRDSRDFERAYGSGLRAGDAHLLIFARPNGLQQTRFGLSVSRKHGGAVQRNRKKRLLREALRACRGRLPMGLDLVLVPRQRPDSTLQDFCASLPALVRRMVRRIPPRDEVPGSG